MFGISNLLKQPYNLPTVNVLFKRVPFPLVFQEQFNLRQAASDWRVSIGVCETALFLNYAKARVQDRLEAEGSQIT